MKALVILSLAFEWETSSNAIPRRAVEIVDCILIGKDVQTRILPHPLYMISWGVKSDKGEVAWEKGQSFSPWMMNEIFRLGPFYYSLPEMQLPV